MLTHRSGDVDSQGKSAKYLILRYLTPFERLLDLFLDLFLDLHLENARARERSPRSLWWVWNFFFLKGGSLDLDFVDC